MYLHLICWNAKNLLNVHKHSFTVINWAHKRKKSFSTKSLHANKSTCTRWKRNAMFHTTLMQNCYTFLNTVIPIYLTTYFIRSRSKMTCMKPSFRQYIILHFEMKWMYNKLLFCSNKLKWNESNELQRSRNDVTISLINHLFKP